MFNVDSIYRRIVILEGQPSESVPGTLVSVPAVKNGRLKKLLQELEKRGWTIRPPLSELYKE